MASINDIHLKFDPTIEEHVLWLKLLCETSQNNITEVGNVWKHNPFGIAIEGRMEELAESAKSYFFLMAKYAKYILLKMDGVHVP